jgi:hypothetical protein
MQPRNLLASIILAAAASPTALLALQASPQPQPSRQTDNPAEIQIDDDCRVLTAVRPTPSKPDPAPRYRHNDIVCHIEGDHTTDVWEQRTVNGMPKKTLVIVKEREYVLQNPTDAPIAFIVSYSLPKGWSIDSDPAPFQITDKAAVFRVIAQPGEIVHLHTGSRNNR